MPEESATNEAMPAISSSAVADELARLLFRNATLVVAPSILVGGLVLGVLFPHVDVVMLLAWGAAVAITIVLRIFLIVGYWRASPPPGGGARWANMYSVATFVAGAVWGLLPVLFLAPAPPEVFLGITMTLVGIAAGSMGLYTSWPAAYVAFTTPVLLTLSVCILLQGEDFVLLGMMGVAAYVVYLGIALLAYSRLREGVLIQFRNRELAERLDAEKARAERESHAKSELLAGISHDLRQPLQSVHLYTDMLRQQSVSQTAEDITDKINHSLWSVTCMVNQLLDLSRMEAGGVEVNMQAVELEPLAERLYGQFMLRADQKGIELEVDCPPLHGWADPVLLTRVLDNLVANALRYTEEGDVCVVFSAVDEQIEIDVLDSGPGIPAEQQERIFDAFYQLEDS
ncbi:MAG: HAMP domain-containing histidine kinase, partial [Spiribacter salinus]